MMAFEHDWIWCLERTYNTDETFSRHVPTSLSASIWLMETTGHE